MERSDIFEWICDMYMMFFYYPCYGLIVLYTKGFGCDISLVHIMLLALYPIYVNEKLIESKMTLD